MIRRSAAPLGTVVAVVGAARLLAWATADALRAALAGSAGFDDLVGLVAGVAGWAALGWVCAVLAATALVAAPGAAGRTAARLSRRITPVAARRLAGLAVGAAVAAGPLSACAPAGDDLPGVGRPGEPLLAEADPGAGPDRGGGAMAAAPAVGEVTPVPVVTAAAGAAPVRDAVPPVPAPPTVLLLPDDTASGEALASGKAPGPVSSSPAEERAGEAPGMVSEAGLAPQPDREPDDAGEVVVRRGDTLWAIAARHLGPGATEAEIAGHWPRWYAANRDVIGPDPDFLLPGTILRPPGGTDQ